MKRESMQFKVDEIKNSIIKANSNNPKHSLFFYIKDGNFAKFKEIIDTKIARIEEKDPEGNSLLCLAVKCNRIEIVDYLLNKGSNVNSQNVTILINLIERM